jgi:molybdopterin converting factor small subunit
VITVRVQTIGLLKSLIRQGDFAVELPEGAAVADLLASVAATYGKQVAVHLAEPDDPAAHPPLRVMVNGRDIAVLGGRGGALADGDVVLMLTPIAGG